MRIKLPSGIVWEGTPVEVLRRLHQTSQPLGSQSYRQYLEGFVERLRPVKVWVEPPPEARASDQAFESWLANEMLRANRWQETTEPTEEEKEAKAKAAAQAKARAAAEAKAKAAAPAKQEGGGTGSPGA